MKQELCFLKSMILAMEKHDSWCGETHIQKNIYLLKELYNSDIIFDFILYKYGPYSFELKDVLQELLVMEDLSLKSHGQYGPSYIVNDNSHCVKDDALLRNIEKVASLTGEKTVAELEKLSTSLFMIKNYSVLSDKEKAEKLHEFKPHIEINAASEAITEMKEIMENINN